MNTAKGLWGLLMFQTYRNVVLGICKNVRETLANTCNMLLVCVQY